MFKSEQAERESAVMRGLRFIHRVARDPRHFSEYGSNLLYFFNFVASTSKASRLREAAREMAGEHSRRWRGVRGPLPPDADAETITDFVLGGHAAQRLGVRDPAAKEQVRRAARRFRAEDFLLFDPCAEPPPGDVPDQCDCGVWNERGRMRCWGCRGKLSLMSRYRVWCIVLTTAYCGECFGVRLGARYADVIQWLPAMRPYRGRDDGANPDFYDTVYALTHLVYTLNDYGRFRLSPDWLPDEFEFLATNLGEAIALDDPDMTGEFLDSLLAFGLTHDHPVVRPGVEYLLSRQNRDGSWGDTEVDVYTRYHATWAAVDGLREYAWRGKRLKFPALLPALEAWAKKRTGRARRRRPSAVLSAAGEDREVNS
jgi:hypothetical protein